MRRERRAEAAKDAINRWKGTIEVMTTDYRQLVLQCRWMDGWMDLLSGNGVATALRNGEADVDVENYYNLFTHIDEYH